MIERHRRRVAGALVGLCCAGALVLPAAARASQPSNDDFANAQLVTSVHGAFSVSGTNVEATTETNEPLAFSNEGTTVWYQWTAPAGGPMQVDTSGSGFDTQLGVYTGTDFASLSLVTSNDDAPDVLTSAVTFQATQGTMYSIQVGGFAKATGSIVLNGALRPPNDDFANAIPLSGYLDIVQGTTFNATTESGEPSILTNQSSVWYTWQPPFTENAFIVNTDPTCTAGFEVAVGTGSTLETFSPFAGGGGVTQFSAQAGTTYTIMVITADNGTATQCDFGLGVVEQAADVNVTQHGKSATTVGTTLVDTVAVTNTGPDTATPLTVDDTIPDGAVYLGVTTPSSGPTWICNAGLTPDNVLQCTISGIAAGQTTKAVIRYVALAPASLDNVVTVTVSPGDPNTADNTSHLLTSVTAAPKTVYATVDGNGFTPAVINLQRGWTVFWQNIDSGAHSATDATGLGLFDLLGQPQPSYGHFTFNGAGVYQVTDTFTDDDETIKVPLGAAPLTGGTSTPFVITWAANNPPDGYLYDIDIKRPGRVWVDWQTTTAKSATFVPDAGAGTYTFRARMRKSSSAAASGWVTRTITVS